MPSNTSGKLVAHVAAVDNTFEDTPLEYIAVGPSSIDSFVAYVNHFDTAMMHSMFQ